MASQELLRTFEEIFEKKLKTEEVTIIENVLLKRDEFEHFCAEVKEIVKKNVVLLRENLGREDNVSFLNLLVRSWYDFCSFFRTLNEVAIIYIDPSSEPPKKEDFHYFGVQEFHHCILSEDEEGSCLKRVQGVTLEMLNKERKGEGSDVFRKHLKDVSQLFVDFSVQHLRGMEFYKKHFEDFLVYESGKIFFEEVSRYFGGELENPLSEYVKRVTSLLKLESELGSECFPPETAKKLEDAVKKEMILAVSRKFFFPEPSLESTGDGDEEEEEDGEGINEEFSCLSMVDNWDGSGRPKLLHVLTVLSLVENGTEPLKDLLQTYITIEGKEITKEEEGKPPQLIIEGLLKLHDKFLSEDGEAQLKTISDICVPTFKEVLNNYEDFPKILSLYIDRHLKKSSGLNEDQFENVMNNFVKLLRYFSEKDLVDEFGKRFLARRLLRSPNVNVDRERAFITRLKVGYGYQFTAKQEGMLKDYVDSEKLNREFKERCVETNFKGEFGYTMEAMVVTAGYWPSFKYENLEVPRNLELGMQRFVEWYKEGREGRYLRWIWNLGEVDVTANGYARKYRLKCSLYQALILNVFNKLRRDLEERLLQEKREREKKEKEEAPINAVEEEEEDEEKKDGEKREKKKLTEDVGNPALSFSEIQRRTGIPKEELMKHIGGLCVSKSANQRVLLKSRRGGPIREDCRFKPNQKFRGTAQRVHVVRWEDMEKMRQKKEMEKRLENERGYLVDAAIVRVMKVRKSLEHRHLVAEVFEIVGRRFQPSVVFIKKRIESLIEREYLERDENDRKVYKYLS